MKFEQYRTQFAFLRENNISTTDEMTAYQSRTEETLADLMKQRTILNVRKKKRQALYDALADVEALAPAKVCYEKGCPAWRKSLPATCKPCAYWNGAASPLSI